MLVKKVAIENVRSFLDRAELLLDGPITIVIGPNGGGKTNLLDIIVTMLRRHLFSSMYAAPAPTQEQPNRYEFRQNDALNNMILERHSAGHDRKQVVEIEVEVTSRDLENMRSMRNDADRLTELAKNKYFNLNLLNAKLWKLEEISAGTQFVYRIIDGSLEQCVESAHNSFLQYLKIFEMDGSLREEFGLAQLATPLVYLPVNRSASGFQSTIELAGYNAFETKRHSDAASSRSSTSIVNLAVGQLAQKYRMLLEKDKGTAASEFRDDINLKELTKLLGELGYEWELASINPLKNRYDIRLKKEGSSFLVGAASSGERELLTYLFAIFALNVRDALIIVDEPELHLHPKWQKTLLQLFIRLANSTGNQFLLATHSPTFVSPESIQYVSRVFSRSQKSHILRLDTKKLPDARHLLNIVNSQNNECLFFADKVVLVEGLSDRIFFEAVLDHHGRSLSSKSILEVISVGGKGLFGAYVKVLRACEIEYSIIADLDYVEQVGSPTIKGLFKTDAQEIKIDVIENVKSYDGDALVRAIDQALKNGNWGNAAQIWNYIKTRCRKLQKDMSAEDKAMLDEFIESKKNEHVYILSRGALEAYLPAGYSSKELDKLIHLLAQDNFWGQLLQDGRDELEIIAKRLLSDSDLANRKLGLADEVVASIVPAQAFTAT